MNDQRNEYLTRDGILKLMTDQEVASVSTAETAESLPEGDEYVDLDHLEQGVRRAHGSVSPMGRMLPRKAVHHETWSKIVSNLARSSR